MALLPQFQSDDQTMTLLQNKWGSILNPVIGNPSNQAQILDGITLAVGSNAVNHKLGRKLRGWRIIRINGVANIYDSQATNQTPALTLQLISDAVVTVSLEVF